MRLQLQTLSNPDHDADPTLPNHDPIVRITALIPALTQVHPRPHPCCQLRLQPLPDPPPSPLPVLLLVSPSMHLGGLWPSGDPLSSACISQGAESFRKALGRGGHAGHLGRTVPECSSLGDPPSGPSPPFRPLGYHEGNPVPPQ